MTQHLVPFLAMSGLTATRRLPSPHRERVELPTPSSRRRSGALVLTFAAIGLLSFNTTRVAGYPYSDYIFVVATVIAWGYLLTGKTTGLASARLRKTPPIIIVGIVLLLTGGTLSSLWSLDPFGSMVEVIRLIWITIIWFWLLRALTPDLPTLKILVGCYKWTMLVAALMAFTNYLGITNFGGIGNGGRQLVFLPHPNSLGGALAAVLPLAALDLHRALDGTDKKKSMLASLQVALLAVGIGTTGSMTAMSAAVVGVLTLEIIRFTIRRPTKRRRATPLLPMVLVTIAGASIVVFANTDFPLMERLTGLITGEGSSIVEESVASRPQQNLYVFDQIDRFLLIGVGHDRTTTQAVWDPGDNVLGQSPHNIVAKLLWEAGLVAVIGFLIIMLGTVRHSLLVIRRSKNPALSELTTALLASLVAVNTTGVLNPVITERWYWMPTALIGVAWALRHAEMDAINNGRPRLKDAQASSGRWT